MAEMFDPFAEEYTPRLDNGQLLRIAAQVEALVADMTSIRALVEKETAKQAEGNKSTLLQMESIVSSFSNNSAKMLKGMLEDARKQIDERIDARLPSAPAEDTEGATE